jgi:hypothetical protein
MTEPVQADNGHRRKRGRPMRDGTYLNQTQGPATPYIRICAGPQRGRYVHDLVLEAKLGRRLGTYETAEHRDGNTLNNDWENIRLLTRSANVSAMHRRRNGDQIEPRE